MAALKARLPGAEITYDDGSDLKRAARAAKEAEVAIVFATKWAVEGTDARDLRLEDGQDALIEAVAKSNRHTVVVLETGNPVLMPWLARIRAVLEVWYPGERGGDAIARLLLGDVNPSGHLPITFPGNENQLPRPVLDGYALTLRAGSQFAPDKLQPFDVKYVEGADVGYRWYAAKKAKPLFPFGFGLSYTRFALEGIKSDGARAEVDVVNTGKRAGAVVAQIYAKPPDGQARLVGFTRGQLAPGERRHVSVDVDRRMLARYDTAARGWHLTAGAYTFTAAQSATDKGITTRVTLPEQHL
jgi:beta-glucosidase